MNIKSTPESIYLFNLALDVNRNELLNELMHNYIMTTLTSDATSAYPCADAVDRVSDVFQ